MVKAKEIKVRVHVYPHEKARYEEAFEEWATAQEARVYFSDWVRLALDRQADRDLGDKPPA